MDRATADKIVSPPPVSTPVHSHTSPPLRYPCPCTQLDVLRASPSVKEVDITGGAPELHDQFRYLVKEIRGMGLSVIDRCNLTVLYEPGQEDLPQFLADNGVRVVASLPCYSAANVNKQVCAVHRGAGVPRCMQCHAVLTRTPCRALPSCSVARACSSAPSKRYWT